MVMTRDKPEGGNREGGYKRWLVTGNERGVLSTTAKGKYACPSRTKRGGRESGENKKGWK